MHWLIFSPLLSLSLLLPLSCLPILYPHNQPPLPSPHHNQNITWTLSVVFPTVFITGLPGGFQASPSACCVCLWLSLSFFACLSVCLWHSSSLQICLLCVWLCFCLRGSLSPHTHAVRSIGKVFLASCSSTVEYRH